MAVAVRSYDYKTFYVYDILYQEFSIKSLIYLSAERQKTAPNNNQFLILRCFINVNIVDVSGIIHKS